MDSVDTFGGLAPEDWLNVATFAGPFLAALVGGLIAIWFAAKRVRLEQEARDIRSYLLDNGASALKTGLDRLLELTRQNYIVCDQLIDAVERTPRGHPLALRPTDIPRFVGEQPIIFNFHAIGATSRLLGCDEVGELTTRAFADLYKINVMWELFIRQPVLRYYEGADWSGLKIPEWRKEMKDLARKNYLEVEEYRHYSDWLSDAVLRAQEMHLAKSADIGRIQDDATIKVLAKKMQDQLRAMQGIQADEDAALAADEASS